MSWLLSPLTWLFLAALVAPVAWFARAGWLAALCVIAAIAAFAAATPLVANALLARLERPAASAPQCRRAPPDTVVILAGGVDRLPRDRLEFDVMNLASRRRTERGVQYWRERNERRIVIAGGPVGHGGVTYADLMGEYARWLGVPGGALRLERRSDNTDENARNVARMAPRLPGRVALVTSAMHMPRARMAFRAAGFEICPLPADFRRVPADPPYALLPSTSALIKTEAALHELTGIAYYRLRGQFDRRRVGGQTADCTRVTARSSPAPRVSRHSICEPRTICDRTVYRGATIHPSTCEFTHDDLPA